VRLAPAGRTTWNLSAALDDSGTAWIAFDATAGTRSDELFLIRTDRKQSEIFRLSPDDGFASKYPDIGLSGGTAALTWFDERDGNQEIYLFASAFADFVAALNERFSARARRITNTPGESIGAYVAINGDAVGLAWCDKSPGQHEIYFQRFDGSGSPLGHIERLTHTSTESMIPAIKPVRDGFALVWSEYAPAANGHIGGRSEIAFAWTRIKH
jgi:hypothetical protein